MQPRDHGGLTHCLVAGIAPILRLRLLRLCHLEAPPVLQSKSSAYIFVTDLPEIKSTNRSQDEQDRAGDENRGADLQ